MQPSDTDWLEYAQHASFCSAQISDLHLEKSNINSLGVIMDGNRRWAKQNNVSNFEGYKAGLKKFMELISWCCAANINYLTVYAFSNENWNRADAQSAFDKDNIQKTAKTFLDLYQIYKDVFLHHGVRVKIIGDVVRFGPELNKLIDMIQAQTSQQTKLTVWICASYGGKQEIVHAVNTLIKANIPHISQLNLETFNECCWSSECPEIDAIVRTSGEKRLSGFMTWKSTYAELFFVDEMWPDFSVTTFQRVCKDFEQRNRRMGL